MTAEHLLTQERRARMAAERLLAQKEKELSQANRQLSSHAIALSEDLVETREKVEVAAVEKSQFLADLERANSEIDIAKRRLWNSIQSIEDGFAVYDADSRLIIANAAYLAPFDGLESVVPGAHYQDVIEAALYEGVIDIEGQSPTEWRDAMLARWFSPAPEPRVLRLWDGTWIRLVDQRAPGGDTVSLGLNITDAMRREAALNRARERAEAANRAKSAFLANMSHEIRTPMNGVVGMADLLADSTLDEEQMIYVDTIRSSGNALLSIINDVLDYSKIEANKLSLHPEPFDLERTILDVLQLLEPSIREKKLKIMLDYDMFLPTRYVGDPVRMRQILTNLMGNAVKFTSSGHVLVRVVGLPDGARAQHRIHITVEDTGIGIPNDKLKAIFGEFNQVEDERNRAYEGTGLGLAITKQLVELMNGELWVESEEGVGSVFGMQVTLPVADQGETPVMPSWVKRALLVMDDDLGRDILEKRLVALGLRVDSTSRAASVDPKRAADADVIFVDHRMADMGAASFIAVLRSAGVAVPVILVAPTTAGRTGKIAGASAVLVKPISRPDLIDVMTALEQETAQGEGAEIEAEATEVVPELDVTAPEMPELGEIAAELPQSDDAALIEPVEMAAEPVEQADPEIMPAPEAEVAPAPQAEIAPQAELAPQPEAPAPAEVETTTQSASIWIEELPVAPAMPQGPAVEDAPQAAAVEAPVAAPMAELEAAAPTPDMPAALPADDLAAEAPAPMVDDLATPDMAELPAAPMADIPADLPVDAAPELPVMETAAPELPQETVDMEAPTSPAAMEPQVEAEAPQAPMAAEPIAAAPEMDLAAPEAVEMPEAVEAPEAIDTPVINMPDPAPSLADALAEVTQAPAELPEAPQAAAPVVPEAPAMPSVDNVVQMQAFAAPRAAETAAPVEAPAPQAEEIAPQAPVAPAVEPAPQATPAAPQAETTAPSAPAQSPAIEPAAPVAATPDVPTPAEPAAPAQRQMRVLAAEDNRTNRLIFSKLVIACVIDLQFATDGSE
ncbi:MAG: ATP-binding protein, partial [Maritimibacter sp.]